MKPGSIIKKHRLKKKLTLEELSKLTSLSVGYISKLERSDRIPPFSTLQTIASVLEVDMAELLGISSKASEEAADKDICIRHGEETAQILNGQDGYVTIPLVSDYKKRNISPILVYLFPGESDVFSHDAEEFLYVISGEVTLLYKNEKHALKSGDSVYLDSRKEHKFINTSDKEAIILTTNYLYRRF